jgi:hypothetical protein
MSDNRAFATQLYEFLVANDTHGYYEKAPADKAIAELQDYLSDLHMVTETIRDIEEIADTFDDHQYYTEEIKPLLSGLREIQGELEIKQRIRMVGETNYEVKHAICIGDKEIVFAEDKKAADGERYFVGDYTSNDIIGQYADCQVSDDFLEAMQEFVARVNGQIVKEMDAIKQSELPREVFTAEHCHRNDYGQNIEGKIVAIKADVLRPEYRRGDVQLVLVMHGSGARADPNGTAIYCYHLNNGKQTRFERHNVQGEVKPEHLPQWAVDKAAEIQAGKAAPPKKPVDKGAR